MKGCFHTSTFVFHTFSMDNFLTICEVGLRDGLQNEATVVGTADKLAILDKLVAAGLTFIEAASFVKPSAVPQMADGDEIMATAVSRYLAPKMRFSGLIFNSRGYDRAVAAGCRHLALALTVTESFCRANNRSTLPQMLATARELTTRAKADGLWVRGYLSTAWVCPFEGPTPPDRTVAMAEAVWEMGVDELSVADTIGFADPVSVGNLMETLGKRLDMHRLAVHLHDTQAMGMANAAAAVQAGVRIFDSSIGGLGGCPFAPGAAGNLATEDMVFLAYKMGYGTGVDFPQLMLLVKELDGIIGRRVGGRIRDWWESNRELA